MTTRIESRLMRAFFGRSRRLCRPVLSACNAWCCLLATLLLFLLTGIRLSGQTTHPPEPSDELPDPAQVMAAYALVRQWVNEFASPMPDDPQARAPIARASGVCVILRHSGRALGIGVDAGGDDLMVRRAAARAMAETLSDPLVQRLAPPHDLTRLDGFEQQATAYLLRSELGGAITCELEVAGRLVPLLGRTTEHIARKIEPGLDGIALRKKESWSFRFPAELRVTNSEGYPEKTVVSLAINAGIPLKDLGTLAQREEIALYRFRTIHLAQSTPGGLPFQTHRGGTIVRDSDVSTQTIRTLADGLALHLLERRWPEPPPGLDRRPVGIMGDYRVIADQHRPLVAPAFDQALVAFALNRYANSVGVDGTIAATARDAAADLLRDLAQVVDDEDDPRDVPAACAMVMYAVTEMPAPEKDPVIDALYRDAIRQVLAVFDPPDGFLDRSRADGLARAIPAHQQAMLAGAMCRLLRTESSPESALEPEHVRQALDAAWRSLAEPQQIGLLPWIGWAEADFAQATERQIEHLNDLRRMIDQLDAIRVGTPDRPAPIDLTGGFELTSDEAVSAAGPRVDAQTLRPASWLAGVFANPQLCPPDESLAAMGRHLRTIRFIMQLSVRETDLWAIRNPRKALGGVRAATWDSEMPIPAQALALITACDTLSSLKNLPN